MTPLVVVAFLVGVWVGYLVGYRNMIAARREARAWAREATKAWQVIAHLEDENSQLKDANVRLLKESADQWDGGWLYATRIDAGSVDS